MVTAYVAAPWKAERTRRGDQNALLSFPLDISISIEVFFLTFWSSLDIKFAHYGKNEISGGSAKNYEE